jgi:hypothetical protein
MQLPNQKNFYDQRRYFQGKDDPGGLHPEPVPQEPLPRAQIVFGILFLMVLALLFLISVHAGSGSITPSAAPAAPGASQAAPSKK